MSGLFKTPGDIDSKLSGASRVSGTGGDDEFDLLPEGGEGAARSPTPGDTGRAGGAGARDSLDSRAPPPGVDTRRRRRPQGRGFSDAMGFDIELPPPPPVTSGPDQKSKFVMEEDVADTACLDIDVILKKEDYGAPGSKDFRNNMKLATDPLPDKLGVANHKIVRKGGAEDGDQTDFQWIQQVIVSIIHRVKEANQHAIKMDWTDIFEVAELEGDLDSDNCADWWNDAKINIFLHWDSCSVEQITAWQLSINRKFSAENRTASRWLKSFIYNSSTDSLRSAVDKKYSLLDPKFRGGVIYLYYTLCEMFEMDSDVKDAMLGFIALFKRRGLARYVGENVLLASEELLGVCRRLHAANALLKDHVNDICIGLTIVNNTRFKELFKSLAVKSDVGEPVLPELEKYATPMESIEAVLTKAVGLHDKLCKAGKWNQAVKGGRGGDGSAHSANTANANDNACWNCGDKNCRVGKCKKPKNQARIDEAKKKWEEKRKNNNNNGGKKGDGNPRQNTNSGKKGDAQYQRKVWESSGLAMINGQLMCKCKQCGFNVTHSTKYHDEWERNKSSFRLPNTHPLKVEKAKMAAAAEIPEAPQHPPGTTPPPAQSGTMTRAQFKAEMEAALAREERHSSDPEASARAEWMRSKFLN